MAHAKRHEKTNLRCTGTVPFQDWAGLPFIRIDLVDESNKKGEALHLYASVKHPLTSLKTGAKIKIVNNK